jgi:hypothetical protein
VRSLRKGRKQRGDVLRQDVLGADAQDPLREGSLRPFRPFFCANGFVCGFALVRTASHFSMMRPISNDSAFGSNHPAGFAGRIAQYDAFRSFICESEKLTSSSAPFGKFLAWSRFLVTFAICCSSSCARIASSLSSSQTTHVTAPVSLSGILFDTK